MTNLIEIFSVGIISGFGISTMMSLIGYGIYKAFKLIEKGE